MLKNYLKIAWRNLLRKKVYSAINITGLAVGVACCVLITMYVQDELSYDRYNTNINSIYRVLHAYRNVKDVDVKAPPSPQEYQVWGNAPVGAALAADFPEIKKVTQFTSPVTFLLEHNERRFQQEGLLFADSATFDIFSWHMLAGNPKEALKAPYSIVLTKSTAQKYFGNENPVGQTLRVENQYTLNVTGVMEDVPVNSHFTFNGLVSMNTFRQFKPDIFTEWGYIDFYTYFLVPEHTDMKIMEAKIPGFVARHFPKDDDEAYTIAFEPLAAAYLHSQAARQPGVTGSLSNVYIFSLIAVFILLIACINFINLSTARSMERAREVGVRKVVGASVTSIIRLLSSDFIRLVLIAIVIATPAVWWAMQQWLQSYAYRIEIQWWMIGLAGILAVITAMITVSFLAMKAAFMNPVKALKTE